MLSAFPARYGYLEEAAKEYAAMGMPALESLARSMGRATRTEI